MRKRVVVRGVVARRRKRGNFKTPEGCQRNNGK
jgi:hypothetical protein